MKTKQTSYQPKAHTFYPESPEQEEGFKKLCCIVGAAGKSGAKTVVLRYAVNLLLKNQAKLEAACAAGFDD